MKKLFESLLTITSTRSAMKRFALGSAVSAAVLAGSAQAQSVTETDQSANFAQGSVGYQANVPSTAVNFLADPGTTLTLSGGAPATPPNGGGGTSEDWAALTDGSFGLVPPSGGGGPGEVAISDNWILTYTFAGSYDITSIDVFTGWGDGGRMQPNVTVNYSTDGTTFLPLQAINYAASGNSAWVHLEVTGLNAIAIQFAFGPQQNGYVGYTELAVQGVKTPQAKILNFGLPGMPAVINQATANIAWTVPHGTAVANLAPTYTLSTGATCDKASGSPHNFTSPVAYKVISSDNLLTNVYTVTVTVAPAPPPGIRFDAASSKSQGAGSSIAWSHSVSAFDANRMLVVGVTTESNPDRTVTGVTFGAQALTQVPGARASNGTTTANASDLWYLPAPALGANTITVTFSGSVGNGTVAGAVSLLGVVQTAPEAVANYSAGNGSTYSASITTLSCGAWLVDAVNNGTVGATFTPTSGQTGRWYSGGGNHAGAGSTREVRSVGATTDTWTSSGTSRRALSVAAFAPVTPLPPAADILAFGLPGNPAVITGTNIALTVPYGSVAALAPTYTLTCGATCPTASGSPQDFTRPVHYVVTSSDSLITNDYKVTVIIRGLPTTNTYNLGAQDFGTTILTGTGGLLPWIPKGILPSGSMLTSFSVNARLDSQATGSDSWADDLTAYVDPYPQGPGTNALLQVGGYNAIGTPATRVAWGTGQTGPPSPLVATRDVSALNIDLSTALLSLGNGYSEATWSGTISVMYEVPPATILTFGLPGIPAVINHAAKTIALTVPYGTALATLAPTFTLSSGTCSPASGVAPTPSFAVNNPATYRVIDAIVARTNDYTVTVTVAAPLAIVQRGTSTTASVTSGTSLTIDKPSGVVAGDVMIVEIAQFVASATNATSTGWTLIKGGTIANAARYGTILYRLADSSDDSVSSYTFTLNPGSVNLAVGAIMAFSGVDPANPLDVVGAGYTTANNETVTASGITTLSPNTAVIMFAMMAYTASPAPAWSAWTTTSPYALSEIADYQAANGTTHYASVGAAWATKVSAGATGSGAATVTPSARNGGILIALKRQVTPADKDIETFCLPGRSATISGTTITLTVPNGTAVTALAPTYTHNGASASPASGFTQDFTTPRPYTVTAQDSSTKTYIVTVKVTPPLPVTDGLIVWLKAEAVDPNDANQVRVVGADTFVKQWNDQSGAGRNASNGTDADQPKYIINALNGSPVLRFTQDNNETGDRLYLGDLSAQTATAGSAFIVATPDERITRGGYTLFDNRDNDGRWLSGPGQYNESTPGTFRGGRDGSFNTPAIRAAWPTSGSHVFALESSSSIYRYVIDGTALPAGTPEYNSGSGQNWTIGNRAQGGSGGSQLNGDIPELIIYNRVLTTTEANQVGRYLSEKYGVATTYVPPGAPTGLTATPAAGAVNLSWTAAATATTYNVQRSTSSGSGYAPIGTSTGTTYADSTGVLGITYYYVVTAQNGGGTSQISNEASAARLKGTAKNILTFGPDAIITGTAIAWTVPSVAVVTALAPTYTVSPFASGSPASGIPRDFTSPQTYTITAEDNSTQDYTVTVTVSPLPVVSGLIVWLKADAMNTGDTNQVRVVGADTFVKQWNDQSGAGRNAANTTEGDQPMYIASGLNGKPVLRFAQDDDDNGDRLYLGDLSAQFASAGAMFAVSTIDNDGRYNLFGNRDNDDRWVADSWSESQPGSFRGGRTGMTYGSWPQTGSHVFAMESSSSAYRFVIDGTQIGNAGGDYNSGSGQNWTIGNRATSGQQLRGDIPELLLYNRVLTTTEANQVGRYLAVKYGLLNTEYTPQAKILSFGLPGMPAVVNQAAKTIAWAVPFGTSVANLAPTYTLSTGATCNKASGSTQNFTTPQTYTVISSDSAITNVYTVTVTVGANPALALIGHWISGAKSLKDTSGFTPAGTHDGVAEGGNAGLLAYSTDVPAGFSGSSLDLTAGGSGNVGVMVKNSATTDAGYLNTYDDAIRSKFTIAFWAKGFPGEWSPWVSKRGEDGIGWQLRRMGGDPVAGFTMRGIDNEDGWGSSINVNDTTWHHYAGVWNQATGTRTLYVDGVLSHVVNNNVGQMMNLAAAKHLALGARERGGTGFEAYFSGLLCDVRIYNIPLFSNQVYAVMTTPMAPDLSMGALSGVPATLQIIGGKQPPTDPNGRALVVSAVVQSANATVTTDGSRVVYTAHNAYTGTDTFTYTVTNNVGGSATATVTVTVTANGTGFNLISGPVNNGNGTSTINFVGIPGYRYALETTAGLALPIAWTPVVTNTTGPHGQASFTFSTSAGQAYFRTRWVP